MQSYKNPFLLADVYYDNDANSDSYSDKYDEDSSDDDTSVSDSNVENNNKNNKIQEYNSLKCYEMYTYNESDNSPKKINISKNNSNSWIEELNAYFKLNNLFTCIRNDENKKQKQDISISNTIMNNIIDKKLGSTTYHYNNKKSAKAYYTYDYPEIYYNKKLYNNISEWLKEEFSKKI